MKFICNALAVKHIKHYKHLFIANLYRQFRRQQKNKNILDLCAMPRCIPKLGGESNTEKYSLQSFRPIKSRL